MSIALALKETNLIEQKDLREQLADRVEILDKVKKLFLIPELEIMTAKQIADYYDVPLNTVNSCYLANQDEIRKFLNFPVDKTEDDVYNNSVPK